MSVKPHILYVIADSSQTGAPRQLYFLVKALQKRYRITVLCPNGWLADQLKSLDCVVEIWQNQHWVWAVDKTLGSLYRKLEPAIIHIHGVRAGIIGSGSAARYRRSQPTVKLVYTEHLWTADFRLPNQWRQAIQLAMLADCGHRSDAVIAVSRAVKDFLITKRLARSESIALIYGGVEPIEPAVKPVTKPIIGTIGSLTWVKGIDRLISVMPAIIEMVPQLICHVAGDGPDKVKLQTQVKELNIDKNVIFIDNVSDPAEFYRGLQLYVQPSLSEAFGMAPLEAMSAGLATVCSRAGALPELVEDGVNGLLFSTNDELAKKIIRLLTDETERRQLGLLGQEQAAHYSVDAMADSHSQLYERLLHA